MSYKAWNCKTTTELLEVIIKNVSGFALFVLWRLLHFLLYSTETTFLKAMCKNSYPNEREVVARIWLANFDYKYHSAFGLNNLQNVTSGAVISEKIKSKISKWINSSNTG